MFILIPNRCCELPYFMEKKLDLTIDNNYYGDP